MLVEHVRLRNCSMSEFYPQFVKYERALVIDQENGGDFAA